eukprot:g17442.t1
MQQLKMEQEQRAEALRKRRAEEREVLVYKQTLDETTRKRQAKSSLLTMLEDIKASYVYDERREEQDSKDFFNYINHVCDVDQLGTAVGVLGQEDRITTKNPVGVVGGTTGTPASAGNMDTELLDRLALIHFVSSRFADITEFDCATGTGRRESGQGTPQGPETRWPRFIGIGDGDFEAEDGWVTVDNSASVVKCGLTQENLATHMTEQYLVSGIRRKGLRVDADWELACQRRDQKHETAVSFALYPMRLQKADSGGIYGSCFDGGFVSLISLHPVLELYCKTGFPEYKKDHDTKYLAYKYQGWITCDTLMVPADSLTLFSLEEAISRGSYNPVDSEEWVGCSYGGTSW